MAISATPQDLTERIRIFRAMAPHFGEVLPASFFKKTSAVIPAVDRIHNLIEGIFKPANSVYPLSIASTLNGPYKDQVFYNPDGSWWIQYSPKAGGMNIAVNAGLTRCMADHEPVLVLQQVSAKTSAEGSRYLFLGPGYVEHFDPTSELFRIHGLDWSEVEAHLGLGLAADDMIKAALRLESLKQWAPFAKEERGVYQVSRQKRDAAFAGIVLDNYDYTCAVSGLRFQSRNHIEAHGAHIISKEERGTDDPRNGLALSRSVHWAFDRGIFTISDQYEVVINPKARAASIANFPLMELDRKKIFLPKDEYYRPHPEALAWHKAEVFDRFSL
jgi:predicted restriction endonuclease